MLGILRHIVFFSGKGIFKKNELMCSETSSLCVYMSKNVSLFSSHAIVINVDSYGLVSYLLYILLRATRVFYVN